MADEAKWAAQNGDLEKLKLLIENGFDVNGQVGGGGRALIHFAADYGQKDILEYLLEKGANVNCTFFPTMLGYSTPTFSTIPVPAQVVDDYGNSPLLNAVFENHKECVRMLLENGADKTAKAPGGETALQIAQSEEIKELLQ